jgi:hypothetical protein
MTIEYLWLLLFPGRNRKFQCHLQFFNFWLRPRKLCFFLERADMRHFIIVFFRADDNSCFLASSYTQSWICHMRGSFLTGGSWCDFWQITDTLMEISDSFYNNFHSSLVYVLDLCLMKICDSFYNRLHSSLVYLLALYLMIDRSFA